MSLKRKTSCLMGVRLLIRARRRGTVVFPPVIQHPRDVGHATRRLKSSKRQFIILRARHFRRGALCSVKHAPAYHQQMGDVVIRSQEGEVGLGLERRVDIQPIPEAVLIAIQQIRIRVLFQLGSIAPQRIGLQKVIVIEEGNIVAVCSGDTAIVFSAIERFSTSSDTMRESAYRSSTSATPQSSGLALTSTSSHCG